MKVEENITIVVKRDQPTLDTNDRLIYNKNITELLIIGVYKIKNVLIMEMIGILK